MGPRWRLLKSSVKSTCMSSNNIQYLFSSQELSFIFVASWAPFRNREVGHEGICGSRLEVYEILV